MNSVLRSLFTLILILSPAVSLAAGKLILLNGTSSAGKTTLANEIVKTFYDSYEIRSYDDYIREYIKTNKIPNGSNLTDSQYNQFTKSMYADLKKTVLSGKNIILDAVEFDLRYNQYCKTLNCEKIYKVIVYCPLDKINERIEKRNKSPDIKEHRPILLAYYQFLDIYKLSRSKNDLIVDKISSDRLKKALTKAKSLAGNKNEAEQLYNRFVKTFRLNELNEIRITTINNYDYSINTDLKPTELSVKELEAFVSGNPK